MLAGKIFKLLPTAALLACAVSATTEEQQVSVASEGQPRVRFVHVHTADILRTLEGYDIGTVLIKL